MKVIAIRSLWFLVMFFITAIAYRQSKPPSNADENKYTPGLPGLIVIVRHAEREPGDDPSLNAAGVQRAQDLVAALRNVKFSAIITTQLVRTCDTAKPVAAALGLTPEIVTITLDFDAHVKALVDAVRKRRGGAVLVVNNSETVGKIIKALGGTLTPSCGSRRAGRSHHTNRRDPYVEHAGLRPSVSAVQDASANRRRIRRHQNRVFQ